MKKGFTLSELMVAMAVLGVLCAVVLPMVMNNNPNQNKMMIKKAYYTVSEVVSDLINDEALYPTLGADETVYVGFDNTESVNLHGKTYSGDTKFAELFATKLNLDGEVVDSCEDFSPVGSSREGEISKQCRSFTTQDGIIWNITECVSQSKVDNEMVKSKVRQIQIDVNGNASPNCQQGSSSDNCKNRTNNFDQVTIRVADNGKISFESGQPWAQEAVEVSSSLTGD